VTTPTYETDDDRRREDGIAATLSAAWRCDVRRQPQYAPVDFHIEEEAAVTGLAELKCRDNPRFAYRDVWFALAKHDALRAEALVRGLPPDRCLFVVSWDDALGWVTVPACAELSPVWRRRSSRPEHTAELVLLVPVVWFTLVMERE